LRHRWELDPEEVAAKRYLVWAIQDRPPISIPLKRTTGGSSLARYICALVGHEMQRPVAQTDGFFITWRKWRDAAAANAGSADDDGYDWAPKDGWMPSMDVLQHLDLVIILGAYGKEPYPEIKTSRLNAVDLLALKLSTTTVFCIEFP
jgi:hypothetical protein